MDLVFDTYGKQTLTCKADDVIEVIPFGTVFCSKNIIDPYEGVLLYRSELLPVVGPVPKMEKDRTNAWVIVFKSHGQICRGVPELLEDIA